MGVTSSSKIIDQQEIPCGGQLGVQLGLSAAPNIVENPVDIVLVLDRSGSMAGVPLASMKLGAETFIDIIAQSTGGGADIGSGSRIAITSFSSSATADTGLITSVSDLKAAVNGLSAGGTTNHAAAFSTAASLFDPSSSSGQIIVMFTDGKTTAGPPPAPVAAAAKQAGAIIYCIGLIGADGIDVDALNEWATQPPAAHVSVTPDAADLEQLFAELAANISKPGATGIVVEEEVAEDFEIISLFPPNRGTAMVLDSRRIR